ncbi:glyoxylase-like metal-dependent hydrolase (beta-lactamase superfamily II) [Rhodoligotrophos appendicifer]|uniref:MBL fold metallo-hydrolase n=1 Tax=Rhodoligotrophos appendicifer TaxID=987056 RepID=UPI001961252E|nr:MBL fold metallo-hydrolase [Rhodoligotrophos appendicifer]
MVDTVRIGDVSVARIEEMLTPGFDPAFLFPDFSPALLERFPILSSPNFLDPASGRLMSSMHSWLLKIGKDVILIDTGCGNHKHRAPAAFKRFHMLDLPFLDRLAEAGVAPEDVTYVINTHLHVDHVGWNTMLVDGQWVPTFPRARYIFGAKEFANWTTDGRSLRAQPEGGPVIVDSVMPVVDAGLVDFVEAGDRLLDVISFVAAPGHTDGQLNIRVESKGETGVFTADVLHQPMQIVCPTLNSRFCEDNERAPLTRRKLLDFAAESDAILFPQHFGAPHAGYARREGSGFAFEPVVWKN